MKWKVRGNLTLNLGVRYEYVSPFTEINNRIANLALSSAVFDPSVPDGAGFGGICYKQREIQVCPAPSCVPTGNNFRATGRLRVEAASRKPWCAEATALTTTQSAYETIAQDLAFQPPLSPCL